MRGLAATLLIGAALTAGGTATYEAYHPQGAAWFNEGKLMPASELADFSAEQTEGIIRQPTNQGNMEAPKYQNNVYADFRATGPPQMDDYPKSPEEATRRSSGEAQPANHIVNYGIYREKADQL